MLAQLPLTKLWEADMWSATYTIQPPGQELVSQELIDQTVIKQGTQLHQHQNSSIPLTNVDPFDSQLGIARVYYPIPHESPRSIKPTKVSRRQVQTTHIQEPLAVQEEDNQRKRTNLLRNDHTLSQLQCQLGQQQVYCIYITRT